MFLKNHFLDNILYEMKWLLSKCHEIWKASKPLINEKNTNIKNSKNNYL